MYLGGVCDFVKDMSNLFDELFDIFFVVFDNLGYLCKKVVIVCNFE